VRGRNSELTAHHFPELDALAKAVLMCRQLEEKASAGNLMKGVTMPAYMIVNLDVEDPASYEEYKAKAPALIKKRGGSAWRRRTQCWRKGWSYGSDRVEGDRRG